MPGPSINDYNDPLVFKRICLLGFDPDLWNPSLGRHKQVARHLNVIKMSHYQFANSVIFNRSIGTNPFENRFLENSTVLPPISFDDSNHLTTGNFELLVIFDQILLPQKCLKF